VAALHALDVVDTHSPSAHGVALNGSHRVVDRASFKPYGVTIFGGHNEFGGEEVRISASERAHCDSAGHELFAMGAMSGVAGIVCLTFGVTLRERQRRASFCATAQL
jgi:hypothetical protein